MPADDVGEKRIVTSMATRYIDIISPISMRRSMAMFQAGDPGGEERMRAMFSPDTIDHQIRQAIQFTWLMLPKEKRTTAEVERVVRHIFERALKDYREDDETFGKSV